MTDEQRALGSVVGAAFWDSMVGGLLPYNGSDLEDWAAACEDIRMAGLDFLSDDDAGRFLFDAWYGSHEGRMRAAGGWWLKRPTFDDLACRPCYVLAARVALAFEPRPPATVLQFARGISRDR